MNNDVLLDLQESVKDTSAFSTLNDYCKICFHFLELLEATNPTRIISPSHNTYICFQYSEKYNNKFTRPLNTDLFIENSIVFKKSFSNFIEFLEELKTEKVSIVDNVKWKEYIASKDLIRIVYTLQQSIGSIGDSFNNPNRSRKRVGQLFENLIKLIIRKLGINCESRVIKIPIPNHEDYTMKYDLERQDIYTRLKSSDLLRQQARTG